MASSLEFVEFCATQIEHCGHVQHKKMFGEYMVYLNGKPIFLICDDTLFVKICDVTSSILGEHAESGYPYNGAKMHYIVVDVDDRDVMANLATELEKITPMPKPKKARENTK